MPLPFAAGLYKKAWLKNYALMLAGLLIDIDHLLADPIYYAERCSIGFHPLHTPLPIILYVMLLAHPKTRAQALACACISYSMAPIASFSNEQLVSQQGWHRTVDGRRNRSKQLCLYCLNLAIGSYTANTGFK